MAVGQGDSVAGQRPGIRGDPEHPAEAAGRQQDGLGPEGVELAVGDPIGDHAGRPTAGPGLAAVEQQVDDVVFVEELDAGLDALLVERLQDHVPGPVGGEARPADGAFPEVPGVAAEAALVDLAVRRPVERQAHVLELDHGLDRLAGEDLGGILVGQVVTALDRVEHVPLPVVLLVVAEGGTDPALGGPGMGAGRVELGQDGRRHPGLGQLQGRPQAGAAGAHDQRIEVLVHRSPSAGWLGQGHDDDRAVGEQDESEEVERRHHGRASGP